jgi:EAL domain-containing protein (putative c-di-GMP-specific phosphodiesterase class I)
LAVRIAVNVSALQMHKRNFVDDVRDVLALAGVSSEYLEIEITEGTLQQEENCISTLEELKDIGIHISIDDFGTGYSCLSSLKMLPIHKVKIDRAFVQDMPGNENDIAIIEAVVAMAHKLKMSVIAEGVETLEQEHLLRKCDCDEVQGCFYARPMPSDDFTKLLRKQ